MTFDDLNKIDNRKYRIRVFTESGTWMLSTILKTPIASQVTMMIIEAFVAMRRYIGNNLLEQKYINQIVLEDHERISHVEEVLDEYKTKQVSETIFFSGQIYDAHSKLVDIMKEAKEELIIVDPYADKTVLDMISNLSTKVTLIIKKERSNLTNTGINKYNEQYNSLKVIKTEESHDRFLIIDKDIIYHCGASINNAGHKTFAINLMEDQMLKNSLLEWLEAIIQSSSND